MISLYVCTTFYLSTHLLMGYVYVLAVLNDAAMNIGTHVSLGDPASNSFGHIPGGGIGSYGNPVFNIF